MDFPEKQKQLLDLMHQCREAPLKRVHFAWPMPIPEGIIPLPFFRITFILTGYAKLETAFDGRIETRIIHMNEAIFFRAFGWHRILPAVGKGLAIVYNPDFIRVVFGPRTIEMHNPRALSTAGSHALRLLDSLALEKNPDQQLCCDTARLLLDITLRDFARPVEDISDAFATFMDIKHFISQNYDKPVNRDSAAEHFNISPGYISQLFRRYSDSSFIDYLIRLRLDQAEYLLLNTNYPISKIAELSGFSSGIRLIKSFRQHFGTSPGRFRFAKKVSHSTG